MRYVFNSVCLLGIYIALNDSKTDFEATKKAEQICKDYSEDWNLTHIRGWISVASHAIFQICTWFPFQMMTWEEDPIRV